MRDRPRSFALLSAVVLVALVGCTGANDRPKYLGNIFPRGVAAALEGSDFFDQVTPENFGKWGRAEAARDRMDWTGLDLTYQYAQERAIPVRMHTLVWGQQQPDWIAALSVEEQRAEVEAWFALAGERYPEFDFIDVVNEPTHEYPSHADALGERGSTGWDWVITSFELARERFPDAGLHLNDYDVLKDPQTLETYLEIVVLLQERDLIDRIGVQGHFLEFTPVAGVTVWGHRQGRTWRRNAYLVRFDGTDRDSMVWLREYLNRTR